MPQATQGPYGTPIIDTFDAVLTPIPWTKIDPTSDDIQSSTDSAPAGTAANVQFGASSHVLDNVTRGRCEVWATANRGDNCQVWARVTGENTANFSGYSLWWNAYPSPPQVILTRWDNGTVVYPNLWTLTPDPGIDGDSFALVCDGPKLEVWRHDQTSWAKLATVNDPTYTTGRIGLGMGYRTETVYAVGGGPLPVPKRTKRREGGTFSAAHAVKRRESGVFVERPLREPSAGPWALPRPFNVDSLGMPRAFAADSPFNTPIPASPAIRANSSAMIALAITDASVPARVLATGDYGVSYAIAKDTDPLNTVDVDTSFGYGADYDPGQFPIPASATPAAGGDHHLAVFHDGKELDQWVASRVDATHWLAGSRYVFDYVNGSGVAPADRFGQTSSNFALAVGLIRPEEIARDLIDHALVFTTPNTANYYVAPATHGDGHSTDPNAMPLGARIQLDPTVDVDALAIKPWEKTLCRALQTYGAFCRDTGGAFAFVAETSVGRGSADIWSAVGIAPTDDFYSAAFPWGSLRVIDWQ